MQAQNTMEMPVQDREKFRYQQYDFDEYEEEETFGHMFKKNNRHHRKHQHRHIDHLEY